VSCCRQGWLAANARLQKHDITVFYALSARLTRTGSPRKDQQRLLLAARVDVALEAP